MSDYKTLLKERVGEILFWADFGNYQGDYVALVGTPERMGFVVIGYGSCSGCDALEACGWGDEPDYDKNVSDLMDSIVNSIFWGTPQEIIARINDEEYITWWSDEQNDEGIARLLDFLKA